MGIAGTTTIDGKDSSNYIPGSGSLGNNKHQEPARLPDNAYDRLGIPDSCSFQKTPNYVMISSGSEAAGVNLSFMFMGHITASIVQSASLSASFSQQLGTAGMIDHKNYLKFGSPSAGTRLDINPIAWSGSAEGIKPIFVYKSGLSSGGR